MATIFDEKAPKRAANLSVNSDLLKRAKELKINLSATFEKALTEVIKAKQRANWKKANEEAINAYNKHVEDNGVFSSGLRSF